MFSRLQISNSFRLTHSGSSLILLSSKPWVSPMAIEKFDLPRAKSR